GEVARAQARAEGAAELAQARAAELARLVAQVEDLRAELARARDQPSTPTGPSPTRRRSRSSEK
ncbi:MAG: hypothetical protein M0Z62_12325, partial [Actinomycetota bacterium]|nr:hypothetical protein [Actinomycetota bacterium]